MVVLLYSDDEDRTQVYFTKYIVIY
jgi:hypothetical protein